MYDYFLGGYHNFEIDRKAADAAIAIYPDFALVMRANRAFLRRAVEYLVAQGVDQFLDIGSGIPTVGNVHEVAQRANPAARVVYVDIDPIAWLIARPSCRGAPPPRSFRPMCSNRKPSSIIRRSGGCSTQGSRWACCWCR